MNKMDAYWKVPHENARSFEEIEIYTCDFVPHGVEMN